MVHQPNAAVFEVAGVARGQSCAAGAGNGGDLGVELGDGTALRATLRSNLREGTRGIFVEGQHAPGEVFRKYRFSLASIRSRRFLRGRSSIPKRISARVIVVTKCSPLS